jgi:hypothetical protein
MTFELPTAACRFSLAPIGGEGRGEGARNINSNAIPQLPTIVRPIVNIICDAARRVIELLGDSRTPVAMVPALSYKCYDFKLYLTFGNRIFNLSPL